MRLHGRLVFLPIGVVLRLGDHGAVVHPVRSLPTLHPKGAGTLPVPYLVVSITPRPIGIAHRFIGGPCPPALLCVLVFIFLLPASISNWTNYSNVLLLGDRHVVYEVEDDAQQKSLALSLLACLGSLFTCLTVCQARRATP